MRLDEMIIKANADGKTYISFDGDFTYCKNVGFLDYQGDTLYPSHVLPFDGWQEKLKRHLTVLEAEKELDCVIDAPKLFRPMDEIPGDKRNVIIVSDSPVNKFNSNYCGFYDLDDTWWRWFNGCAPRISDACGYHWIDPEDLIKLLPKE